jgi:hypothetical protein
MALTPEILSVTADQWRAALPLAKRRLEQRMYEVWIQLSGGTPYHLCTATDLHYLWAVVESLLADGARGVNEVRVVRVPVVV